MSFSFFACSEQKIVSVEVLNMPTKTVYKVGESLSLQGMTLKVFYEDDSKIVEPTLSMISGFDSGAYSLKQTLTVTYTEGKETVQTTFDVQILPPIPQNYTAVTGDDYFYCYPSTMTGSNGMYMSSTLTEMLMFQKTEYTEEINFDDLDLEAFMPIINEALSQLGANVEVEDFNTVTHSGKDAVEMALKLSIAAGVTSVDMKIKMLAVYGNGNAYMLIYGYVDLPLATNNYNAIKSCFIVL